MYIELIDLLRCPRVHEESWLVAAFNKMDGRFVIEGKLGCPVCSASYPITDGVADLREWREASVAAPTTPAIEADSDTAVRVAAMLGLTRAGSVAVLSSMPASIAGLVSEMASVRVLGANAITPAAEQENVAMIRSGDRLPFATGSIDAVMLETTVSNSEVEEAVRILKTGGRLVVTADSPLRGNLRELARDDRYIVAESTGPLLGLTR
ncbi:MAG TPA: hypothetical protein VM053_07220 [Gemmatimonadaceae bacterium]|nr:hypothetical protein [Gemmatimonadaceae bacterium]